MTSKFRLTGMAAIAAIVLFGLAIAFKLPWLPHGGQAVSATVKRWFTPAPQPTLLVTTDSDCDWKLDGKSCGRLRAKEISLRSVVLGQHLIEASTLDGKDEWRGVVELHTEEQHVAAIGLEALRLKRLASETAQEEKRHFDAKRVGEEMRRAEEKRIAEANNAAEAVQEAEAERQQQAVNEEWAQQRKQAIARGCWTDPRTQLVWVQRTDSDLKDSPSAIRTCSSLRVGGFSDWRLPEIEEVEDLFSQVAVTVTATPQRKGSKKRPYPGGPYRRIPIDVSVSMPLWSASKDPYGKVWVFDAPNGPRKPMTLTHGNVLCVRGGGNRM